jgi:predicted nuclease with TOPRIM domain
MKKSKNLKDGDGEADGEGGKSYKELYENAKSGYDDEYQKRVDCEKENTRLEGDNRDLKSDIETLKSDKVNLVHQKAILEKEIVHNGKALAKAEDEVVYFKNILHPPQVSQYPSTSTLGGASVSQRGLSPQNIASNGFVSPP